MSENSNGEKRLNKVTQERNELRDVVQKQALELAELRRIIERAEILNGALAGHALPIINAAIERLQLDRDQAIQERDELWNLILRFRTQARQEFYELQEDYEQQLKLIDQARLENGQPHLVEALIEVHDAVEEITVANFKNLLASVEAENIEPVALVRRASITLYEAGELKTIMSRRDFGRFLILQAFTHSASPPLLCDHICRSLRISGTAPLSVIEKLGKDWININLPEPPNIATLQEGLELASKQRKSRMSREAFAHFHHSSRRALDRYHRWYRVIEAQANKLPEEMGERVEQKIRSKTKKLSVTVASSQSHQKAG